MNAKDRKDLTPSEAVKAWQEIEKKQGERNDLKELCPKLGQSKPIIQASNITGIGKNTLSKALL
jgi:hypothetical protein